MILAQEFMRALSNQIDMKAQFLFPLVLLALFTIASCNNAGSGSDRTDTTATGDSAAVNSTDNTATDTSAAVGNATKPITDTLDKSTKEFVTKAADGGMAEVELGQLAQQNAASQRVKDFGSMMVRDHSVANNELKALLTGSNVVLPDSLSKKHQQHRDNLAKKQGAAFDKAYMKMMVDDHQKDVSEFEKASKDSKIEQIKAFATKTLPVLRTHLDSAKAINKSL